MEDIPTTLWVVAGALRERHGRWLLRRRPSQKHHGRLWEFPGGKVESSETPTEALVRELREELGIQTNCGMLKPRAFVEDGKHEGESCVVILLYTVDDWRGEPIAVEEGSAVGWFDEEQIARLPMPPLDVRLCQMLLPQGR